MAHFHSFFFFLFLSTGIVMSATFYSSCSVCHGMWLSTKSKARKKWVSLPDVRINYDFKCIIADKSGGDIINEFCFNFFIRNALHSLIACNGIKNIHHRMQFYFFIFYLFLVSLKSILHNNSVNDISMFVQHLDFYTKQTACAGRQWKIYGSTGKENMHKILQIFFLFFFFRFTHAIQ